MKIIQASNQDVFTIQNIVHTTINKIYPKYYPTDVVQFFLDYHSSDNIKKAINEDFILLIEKDGQFIGTGSILKNEIKRMFVLPEFQNKGCGSLLLNKLEQKAAEDGYASVELDSSLPAYSLYEKKGYTPIKNERIVTQSGQVLCFSRISKTVNNPECKIDYNNRMFTSAFNNDNGEVSDKTVFKYKQQKDIIWAEYSGGEIIRSYLIGTSDNEGKLEFYYQHINIRKEIRTGRCKSTPQVLPDERIRLTEEWEWTNGDKSKGSSIIEEIR